MILVICDEADTSALWAADALKKRGLSPLLITSTDLARVENWQHTVGVNAADCEIRLANGWCFRTSEVDGALNRIACVPWQWQRRFGGDDHAYALQEMYAFYLSWLNTLRGSVFNKPTPQGLCGNMRHPSAWTALGVRVGLPVKPYCQSAEDAAPVVWYATDSSPSGNMLYVIGTHVVGPQFLLQPYREACLRLAAEADVELLGINFEFDDEFGCRMCGASVMPNLIHGGDELIDVMEEVFST